MPYVLTTCAACAAPLAHDAPTHCVRCNTMAEQAIGGCVKQLLGLVFIESTIYLPTLSCTVVHCDSEINSELSMNINNYTAHF